MLTKRGDTLTIMPEEPGNGKAVVQINASVGIIALLTWKRAMVLKVRCMANDTIARL